MSSQNNALKKLQEAQTATQNGHHLEAVALYQQAMQEDPELAKKGLGISLAHNLILSIDWKKVSQNLPAEINYLDSSGWLESLKQGKPVNKEGKPIPWYTYPAIEFIEDKLSQYFVVFEYGAGNSTLWFAERVRSVVSVESDPNWFNMIRSEMPQNVEISLIQDPEIYAKKIEEYPDKYFDIIIVDGINRNQCAQKAISKLKETGFIIFDNTDNWEHDQGNISLLEAGFKQIDFYGLIPSYTYKNCTSLFFKSTEILETKEIPSDKSSCLGKSCFQVTNPKIKKVNQLPTMKEKNTLSKEKENLKTSQQSNNRLVCVDLGCGTHKAEGFIGVDIVPADGVDVVADLNETFPFPDNSVDVIKAHDFIEHLPNKIQTMNELWRILKPNGVVDISVPSTDGRGAFQDPTHVSYWNINSFMYYCQEHPAYLAGCKSHYGFEGEFSIINIRNVESLGNIVHVHTQLRAIKSENSYPLNLRDFSIIFFPDWNQTQEIIYQQLQTIFKVIIEHPKGVDVSLLINVEDIEMEEIDLFVSEFLLSLYTDYEPHNLPEINILKTNSIEEYKGLSTLVNHLITTDSNQYLTLFEISLDQIPCCTLENFRPNLIKI